MKRSPLSLSSVAKRSLIGLGAALWAVLVMNSNVLAVPIAVDMYQDMETGNAGDTLTTTMMNSTSHPSSGWTTSAGSLFWVSTNYHRDLPGPVTVGGTTYNGTGGSRSWQFRDDNQLNYVVFNGSGSAEVTMACYYTTLTTLTNQVGYDTLIMFGGSFGVMQTLGGPCLHAHSKATVNSTGSTAYIGITTGKTYWVNLKYDGSDAKVWFAAFDADNSYALVGTTYAPSIYNDTSMGWKNFFGRADQHQNQSNDVTYSYIDQMVFDWTNAAFPLLLCGPNDSTAPSAAGRSGWNRPRSVHRALNHAIVGELGHGLGRRERYQGLPICHRHCPGRHQRRELDHAEVPVGNNENRT